MEKLFRWFAPWPLGALHALGAALGWVVYGLSPTYRRRFQAHVRLAGYSAAEVRGAIAHAGRMVAELPRLWLGPALPTEWEGLELVQQAYAARRGVIFLTPHMGCFEISAQGLAQRFAPDYGPLTVLYRPARQPWLAGIMQEARQRPGLLTAPTNLAGVRQMLKALRQGHAVGLLPDQVPPEGLGLWSPFFGQPAYTMTLGARLAQQTGAQVLLLWAERLPRGTGYRLHFRALRESLSDELALAVGQINREMERLVRECPQQYLWGYGRYKQPRKEL